MSKPDATPVRSKPGRLLRRLAFAAVAALILLVGGWLVVTSAVFFKGVILPRVGATLNADISVSDATIQPMKQVVLRDFKLQFRGEEEFLAVAELRCRYRLLDILGGTLTVDEATLISPRLHYLHKPDGTSNLDPLFRTQASKSPASAPAQPSRPLKLNIRRVTIEDAALLYASADLAGNRTSVELDDIALVLADLRNGGEASLELGATLKASRASLATNGLLQATIAARFQAGLDAEAMLKSIQGKATFDVTDARGTLADLAALALALDCQMSESEIQHLTLNVRQGAEDLTQMRVSGPFVPGKGEGRLAVELSGVDHRLLNLAGSSWDATFGHPELTSTNLLVLQRSFGAGALTGQLRVRDLAMTRGGQTVPPIQAFLDYDLAFDVEDGFWIKQARLEASHDGRSLLLFELEGGGSRTNSAVSLNAALVAHLKEINDVLPASDFRLPDDTLGARVSMEARITNQVATIERATLALDPTPRATNELTLTGRVDFSDQNAVSGHLLLAADSLDATRYYDLLEQMQSGSSSGSGPSGAPAADAAELPATRVPLRDFVVDLAVRALQWREVSVSDWSASLRFDGGRVKLSPCRLMLNGAPVTATADLNLGVPGWEYQFAGSMDAVPVAPLVNSFLPERQGQFSGTANFQAKIQGAGSTGPMLQQNLDGQFDLGATNLNFALESARSKLVRTLAEVLSTLPDLARNPGGAAVGRVVGAVLGAPRAADSGEWAGQLQGSPVDVIRFRGAIDKGELRIIDALAQSRAYQIHASGGVTLAPAWTNSQLRLPVEISLSRELAAKTGLLPANTPIHAPYARLPDFLTLEGSVGNPRPKINYLALGALATQSGASLTGSTGNKDLDKASRILGTMGSLLGGGPASRTNIVPKAGTTNAPESSPELLDGVRPGTD
ncbi:MAG: AsmA family protein [Verrucomicrobia bacterium]|nr:AsmA family protein [Verrucomicrobiota bacterium]